MMKRALMIVGPSQIRIEEVPVGKLGDYEVLVEVKACGICGTDYELYTNDMVYIRDGRSKLPIIPGHEWSGIVYKVGKLVTKFKRGDKVVGECTVSCGKCEFCIAGHYNQCVDRTETGVLNREGGFAEYISFPETHLHKFNGISFEEASLVEPTAVAFYGLMRGNVTPMDNVLVIGPGPIGLQVAQIAKRVYGAKNVILSGTRNERLNVAKEFGIDMIVNIREENLVEKIREITNGEMIHVVIEASGSSSAFEDISKLIRPCGRIVLVGFYGSKGVNVDWDSFITRDISIFGSLGSPRIWDNVINLLETGKITSKPLITHRLKLEEFEKGLELMINRREGVIKVIVIP